MAVMTPNATSNLNITKWARRLEPALYDFMKFIPKTKEAAEQIMNGLYVRRLGAISTQNLADTEEGTGCTFSTITPTRILLSPSWIIAAVAYPDSSPRRQGDEINAAYAANVESALGAGLDAYGLAFIQSSVTTTPIGNAAYNIDAAGLRSAVAALATNSKLSVEPGDASVYLLLDPGQADDALAIPEINQAYQRGDGRSPQLSGKITTGYGLEIDFTTLLATDANGKHGAAFKGEFLQYGYNKRPSPEKQRYMKQTRIMADAEIGANVIYNELVVPIRTV